MEPSEWFNERGKIFFSFCYGVLIRPRYRDRVSRRLKHYENISGLAVPSVIVCVLKYFIVMCRSVIRV